MKTTYYPKYSLRRFPHAAWLARCAQALSAIWLLTSCTPIPRNVPAEYTYVEDHALFDGKLYALIVMDSGTRRRAWMGEGEAFSTSKRRFGIVEINIAPGESAPSKLIGCCSTSDPSILRQGGMFLCSSNAIVCCGPSNQIARIVLSAESNAKGLDLNTAGSLRAQNSLLLHKSQDRRFAFSCSAPGSESGAETIDLQQMKPAQTPSAAAAARVVCESWSHGDYPNVVVSRDLDWALISTYVPRSLSFVSLPSLQPIFRVDNVKWSGPVLGAVRVADQYLWVVGERSPTESALVMYSSTGQEVARLVGYTKAACDPDLRRVVVLSGIHLGAGAKVEVITWRPFDKRVARVKTSLAEAVRNIRRGS